MLFAGIARQRGFSAGVSPRFFLIPQGHEKNKSDLLTDVLPNIAQGEPKATANPVAFGLFLL